MPRKNHFDPDPGIAGKVDPFSPLWLRLEALTKKIGIKSLIRWADKIISVAGPVGPVFMSTIPTSVADGKCRTLSILSANLWHDWPRFRNIEKRLESFAKLVEQEGIDLILLQEIARTPAIKVDNLLAERLNMSYVYSRANGSANIGFEEGLGVFSRFRMKRFPEIRQVGRVINPFVRRLAIGVDVETPCGSILAVSVHLGLLRGHNTRQVTELHHWINRLAAGRSVVIGGDFNAPEKSRRIGKVRTFWLDAYQEAPTRDRSHTHSIKWPWGGHLMSHRIDYIFLHPGIPGWNVTEAYHLDAPGGPHSDHLAVVARLAPVHNQ